MAENNTSTDSIRLVAYPNPNARHPPLDDGDSDQHGLLRDQAGYQDTSSFDNRATIRKSATLPLSQWMVHGVSIAFTAVVMTLCAWNLYFADLTLKNINAILNAFQFIATLHTIIISSSFTYIAAFQLRYELCDGEGVPVGLLDTPFQLSSIQILFTSRFWLAITAKENTIRIYLFGISILVTLILTALTNPASATLIVPQLRWWSVHEPLSNVNGFSYLNGSHEYMWPSQINASIVPPDCTPTVDRIHLNCPYAGMRNIAQWSSDYLGQFSEPNITVFSDANMMRYLGSMSIYNDDGYATSSTGMSHLTSDLGNMWLYAHRHNISFARWARPMIKLSLQSHSQPLMRPLVQTQCGKLYNIADRDALEISFPSKNLSMTKDEISFNPNMVRQIKTAPFRSALPKVRFTDLSVEAGKPALGAVAGMSFYHAKNMSDSPFGDNFGNGLIPCTISTHWVPTHMSYDPNTANAAILDNPHLRDFLHSQYLTPRARSIDINISYANIVNAELGSPENRVLDYELGFLTTGENKDFRFDGSWGKKWSWVVSTLISLQVSDALARIKERMAMMVLCEGNNCYDHKFVTVQNIRPQNSPFSIRPIPNNDLSAYHENIMAHPELYTPAEWTIERYGYGWGFNEVTEWLAAVVLALNAAIVLAHLFFVLIQKWRCDGWDDLLGLIALAIQSPSTNTLEGTNTGAIKSSTYAKPVMIRENDAGTAPVLVVGDGGNISASKKLVAGKNYG